MNYGEFFLWLFAEMNWDQRLLGCFYVLLSHDRQVSYRIIRLFNYLCCTDMLLFLFFLLLLNPIMSFEKIICNSRKQPKREDGIWMGSSTSSKASR